MEKGDRLTEPRRVLLGLSGTSPETPATLEEEDDAFRLRPDEAFEDLRQVISLPGANDRAVALSGDPRLVAADWAPRTLWGMNEGRPFTVFSANMRANTVPFTGFKPIYSAQSILWGVQVEGPDSKATAVRLRFNFSPTGWSDEDPVDTDSGRLRAWLGERQVDGLEWEPSSPQTIENLMGGFPQVFTTLFHLWTGKPKSVTGIQVHIEGVGWCDLTRIGDGGSVKQVYSPFLDLNQLTLKIVGKWLSMADQLGPIPFMVFPGNLVLQVDAFVVASALEGLHRRLHPEEKRFEWDVSNSKLDKAKKAARTAGVETLQPTVESKEAVQRAFREAVGHVEDLTFTERVTRLVNRCADLVPGLLGPSADDWTEDLKEVRNTQSHALPKHDGFGQDQVSLYYVMSRTGRWLLRIRLLLELVDDAHMRTALRQSSDFTMTLADLDLEEYWPDYSAYDAFYAALEG